MRLCHRLYQHLRIDCRNKWQYVTSFKYDVKYKYFENSHLTYIILLLINSFVFVDFFWVNLFSSQQIFLNRCGKYLSKFFIRWKIHTDFQLIFNFFNHRHVFSLFEFTVFLLCFSNQHDAPLSVRESVETGSFVYVYVRVCSFRFILIGSRPFACLRTIPSDNTDELAHSCLCKCSLADRKFWKWRTHILTRKRVLCHFQRSTQRRSVVWERILILWWTYEYWLFLMRI